MKKRLNPKIPCPELLGINLTIDAACTNEKCGKPVATIPRERERERERERIATCKNYNNTMRVKKYE